MLGVYADPGDLEEANWQDLVVQVVVTKPPPAGGFSVSHKVKGCVPAGSVGTALCLLPVWLGDFLLLLGFCSISCHY